MVSATSLVTSAALAKGLSGVSGGRTAALRLRSLPPFLRAASQSAAESGS
jgi:hypothetical protein